MAKLVPFLSEEAIEREAAVLLAEYSHARGAIIDPPIPIEDIVEKHLKLGILITCSACPVRRRTRHPRSDIL
ncbi:hypothetical protein ABIB75_007670 [Bradyrhizobium sp. GM2.2]|uniref:hypothetical protein n=1 Tax=Bradyrhizobium sp. GM2.2 TaxID=3156358 RepID=UPI00339A1BBA